MEKDILREFGLEEDEDDEEDDEEEDHEEENIDELRKEFESAVALEAERRAIPELNEPVQTIPEPKEAVQSTPEAKEIAETYNTIPSDVSKGARDIEEDEVNELRQFDDTRSTFSFSNVTVASSAASTIAPDVVKRRVKAALARRKAEETKKRMRAKGEASAATRSRRDNADTIKTSTSAFWADDY